MTDPHPPDARVPADPAADRAVAPAGEAQQAAPSAGDLQAELTEAKDRWLRTRAELENLRRRARTEVEQARAYGTQELLREVLPVLDALQRALAQVPSEAPPGAFVQGLALTEEEFVRVLGRHGVTPVPAAPGTPADPGLHRILVEQPSAEHPPGTILAEVTRGYRLGDRLLREAEVVIAGRPPPAPS